MEESIEPTAWALMKRYAIGWFQLQFVLGLLVNVTLFRYASEEISILIFNEIPLLVLLYTTITHDAFSRVIKHHSIKSTHHAWQLGVVSRWWSQMAAVLVALASTMLLLQNRVYLSLPICGILFFLQRRAQWYPHMTTIYRRAGAEGAALIQSDIESQENIVAIARHCIMLFILAYPDNVTIALYVSLASHAIESFAQSAIYQYQIKRNDTTAWLPANIEYDSAPGFTEGFHIMRKALPYIISALKGSLFQRGEHIAVLLIAQSTHVIHYYTILKSIRTALITLIAQPIAYYMQMVFSRDNHRTLLSILTGIHGLGWLILNIFSWVAAPIMVWPILYYYGGQEALDKPELVRAVILLLMLFPIDIANAVTIIYWQVHETKPIALWLDVFMSLLYVLFSVEVMRVWQLSGLVYGFSVPVLWSALMRGAL